MSRCETNKFEVLLIVIANLKLKDIGLGEVILLKGIKRIDKLGEIEIIKL